MDRLDPLKPPTQINVDFIPTNQGRSECDPKDTEIQAGRSAVNVLLCYA